jgi:lipopolysaccharide assembly outer membrane protein LptD (OstA)
MKKIIIIALAIISLGGYWLILKRPATIQTHSTDLEARLITNDALLICTNLRASHIKNKWGNLTLVTPECCVTQDHIVKTTAIRATLEQLHATTIITAGQATLTPNTQVINLAGDVHAQKGDISIKSDALVLNSKNHTLHAAGNVAINHPQGHVYADKAFLDQQEKILRVEGHVRSELGLHRKSR